MKYAIIMSVRSWVMGQIEPVTFYVSDIYRCPVSRRVGMSDAKIVSVVRGGGKNVSILVGVSMVEGVLRNIVGK